MRLQAGHRINRDVKSASVYVSRVFFFMVLNMPSANNISIMQLLADWERGIAGTRDRLFRLLYDEMHHLAHQQRRRWRGNYTMNTTALVHEVYLKLDKQESISVRDQSHFTALLAKAFRHILVDYAKKVKRKKHGGDVQKISLEGLKEVSEVAEAEVEEDADRLLALDKALELLAATDTRTAQALELHYFIGLTYEEIAEIQDVSEKTVQRDHKKGIALLRRLLQEG